MEGYEVMPAVEAAAMGDVFITVTGDRDVARRASTSSVMRDGAILCNAGHFDVEIDQADAARARRRAPRRCARTSSEHVLADGRRINLLADGRVVNLAAAEGNPAAVMDMSFANQALAAEHLVATARHLATQRPRASRRDRRRGRAPEARRRWASRSTRSPTRSRRT